MKRYMFDNLLSWFLTCLKFVLFVHYFACGWVIIERIKHLHGVKRLEFVETSVIFRYFESFYLITSTITTIGFGDYKAFNDEDPVWALEMCYLYFVILAGIILFSLVTNEIFTYEKIKTVNEIVNETVTDMEEYLYNVSKVRPEKFLGTDYIDECLGFMEEHIRNSTRYHFTGSWYYNELPQSL